MWITDSRGGGISLEYGKGRAHPTRSIPFSFLLILSYPLLTFPPPLPSIVVPWALMSIEGRMKPLVRNASLSTKIIAISLPPRHAPPCLASPTMRGLSGTRWRPKHACLIYRRDIHIQIYKYIHACMHSFIHLFFSMWFIHSSTTALYVGMLSVPLCFLTRCLRTSFYR